LIVQTLIILFAVTCQDGTKRFFNDDDSSRLYHLTGVALDHQTDEPVFELTVSVIADSTYQTVTDSTGHYSLIFEALPNVYKVTFQKRNYASMYINQEFPEHHPPSGATGKSASLPALISVTKDVRLYPLTKQVEGTVLGYTWDYPEWPDDSLCILPRISCIRVYISYAGVEQIEQAGMTLDYMLYWMCTDEQGNYFLGDVPHTDSAFIGIIPFCWEDLCFYGSRSAISLDNSEPVDLQLVAAPMFDRMYEYIGYDTLQRQIVSGWLGINDPDSAGQFGGAWSIKKYNPEPWPIDMGPQEGNGLLTGQIHGNELTIDLNPGMADSNVMLVADTGYYQLRGTWHFSTFVGEVNCGTFEANRVELGP
jgi:hypothetical protein